MSSSRVPGSWLCLVRLTPVRGGTYFEIRRRGIPAAVGPAAPNFATRIERFRGDNGPYQSGLVVP